MFRRSGWNELGEKGIAPIREKFIPYAPFWGGHGFSNLDAWWEKYYANHRFVEGTFDGTPWVMIRVLPESKRRAVVDDRGTAHPEWKAATTFPPGGIALNVWTRPLKRGGNGGFLPQIGESVTARRRRPNGNSAPRKSSRSTGMRVLSGTRCG